MADQDLKILVKVEGDTRDLDEVKTKLGALGQQAQQTGQDFSRLGSLIGVGVGAGLATGIAQITNAIVEWGEEIRQTATEQLKFTQEVNRAVLAWDEMVKTVRTLRGEIQLADAVNRELAKMSLEMAKFRERELPLWQRFWDSLTKLSWASSGTPGPFAAGVQAEVNKRQEEYNRLVKDAGIETVRAADATKEWEADRAKGAATMPVYSDRIAALRGQLDQLTESLRISPEDVEIQNTFRTVAKDLQETEERYKILQGDQAKLNRGVKEEETDRRDITALMREQATMLQNIQQTQQLISESPFMGADEKQRALLASSRLEMTNISQAIEATQSALSGSGLDASQYEQLDQRLQTLRFRFRQLNQEIQSMDFGGGLRTELTSWANSFGTTAQQVGKTIEQTIGTSLQAVNQLLVTGKFDAQALLQQLVLLGLQLVEQMILQRIMSAINAAASAGQAAATGPLVAAAWAPAATAATIATQGAAAVQAPVAVATALALIQGMLVIAHEGGPIRRRRMHGGGLSADEVPIIAQEGEIMIRRDVAQAPGMTDFLLGINAGRFHDGGGRFRGIRHRAVSTWDVPRQDLLWTPGMMAAAVGAGFWGGGPSSIGGLGGFGIHSGPQGMTIIPTYESRTYAGIPMAAPAGGWGLSGIGGWGVPGGGTFMGGTMGDYVRQLGKFAPTGHRGGLISRYHGGGTVAGAGGGGKGIHIYAFTDLKQLTRHMASRDGQKIIFDTVKGRRIDLGMS